MYVKPARFKAILLTLVILGLSPLLLADYSEHLDAKKLVEELVAEEGFDEQELNALLNSAQKKQSIIDAMNRPAEKIMTWGRYRNIFLKAPRIKSGADFWQKNLEPLTAVEEEFGIPAEIVVAIIGVETLYGSNKGSYRVIDALSTLTFDYPRRAKFFRSELKHFLRLANEQKQDPLTLVGSYAGAMGLGQFMPSSYRAYAKDYDKDGFIDIWNNEADAIWSVGNYLHDHGWIPGKPIASKAVASNQVSEDVINQDLKPLLTIRDLDASGMSLDREHLVDMNMSDVEMNALATAMRLEGSEGEEYWVGFENFYVITRYNHSKLYAMAVFQLAEAVRYEYAKR